MVFDRIPWPRVKHPGSNCLGHRFAAWSCGTCSLIGQAREVANLSGIFEDCAILAKSRARFAALDGCAAPLSWKLASKFWPGDFWILIPDGDC